MQNEDTILTEKILWEADDGGKQLRYVVSTFRGVAYIHLREYYLSFDEGYVPSKEGVNIPVTIVGVRALLEGLAETLSDSEFRHILEEALNASKKHI